MLIRFRVSNYLSFNEMQEFTTMKGRVRTKKEHLLTDTKPELLKFSAVYGANASGKSNLISALSLSRRIILGGIPSGISRDYHRLHQENKNKPTLFEYEIRLGNKCYAYGFDIILSEGKIIGEWLYEIYPNKQDKLIYEREPEKEEQHRYLIGHKYKKSDLTTYIRGMETETSLLLLTDINRGKQSLYTQNPELQVLKDVFSWIAQKLIITSAGLPLPTPLFYLRDDFKIDSLDEILPSLGLGITKTKISNEKIETVQAALTPHEFSRMRQETETIIKQAESAVGKKPKKLTLAVHANRQYFILIIDVDTFKIHPKRLQFVHDGCDTTLFDLSEESDGTQRIFELLEILFAAANGSDCTYVIDEIDRSLHPLLTRRLIELYLSLSQNAKMQLLVTTHESQLMDQNLLRSDEIWLINKKSTGVSELYSLDQFNVRFDKKISRDYMDGRYGAVPSFDEPRFEVLRSQ